MDPKASDRDVSRIALPGSDDGPAKERARELGVDWPEGYPVVYLSLGGLGAGVPIRARASDFGPLLAKVLGSNQTRLWSTVLMWLFAEVQHFLKSSTGKTIQRELARGLFGLLKKRP